MNTPKKRINYMSVRELRAKLAAALNGPEPIAVGKPWELRAWIVPVPRHRGGWLDDRRNALEVMQKQFNAVIDALIDAYSKGVRDV